MHKIKNLIGKINLDQIKNQIQEFDLITPDFSSSEYIEKLKKNGSNSELLKLITNANKLLEDQESNNELLDDPEMSSMAKEDIEKINSELDSLYSSIEELTNEPLENDEKKAIIEIRPGVGGVEAALFAEDLLNMYQRFCLANKIKIEVFSISYNQEGGITEAVIRINDENSFAKFRFESGVHRVQRVPKTETLGRVHTSTASVVVMPEASLDSMQINPSDLRIDVYRSSGPGGQSVNTTDSAVRITHLPSKLIVTCQTSKSQHSNKEMAMTILISRLKEIEDEKRSSELNSIRNSSIMGGKRSSKIRTYNFPQGRITDHRIGKSWFNINEVVYEGKLENIVNSTNKAIRSGEFATDSNNEED